MQIRSNQVHIWTADLTISHEQETKQWQLLSEDEKERANRFHFPIHKKYFVAARSHLRILLSLYLDVSPEEVLFAYHEQGKPFLQFPESNLQFNLSHSHERALYGFTLDHAIGVDIEKISEEFNPALIRRFFSKSEIQLLLRLPGDEQATSFYHIWSKKEALIKAASRGLAIPLSSFSVSLTEKLEEVRLNDEIWSLFPFTVHRDFASAVASNKSLHSVQFWSLYDQKPKLDKTLDLAV